MNRWLRTFVRLSLQFCKFLFGRCKALITLISEAEKSATLQRLQLVELGDVRGDQAPCKKAPEAASQDCGALSGAAEGLTFTC